MADWDNKAMKGSDIQSALTQVYTDIAYKDAYDGKWIGPGNPVTSSMNTDELKYWRLCSFTISSWWSFQFEMDVTNGLYDGNIYETKIVRLGGGASGTTVDFAQEIREYHGVLNTDRGYGNIIYYTLSGTTVTVYVRSKRTYNVSQFCRLNKVADQWSITGLTWYSETSVPEQPSSPTKFTEVIGGTLVDVSSYTTYASILAVVNAGGLPYYRYTSGNTTIDLMFAGTRAIPNVGMALEFNAVQDQTIYYVGFGGSSSSFGTVRTFPLFSSDNVKTSSDTSSWSSDNTNVPTRAAVDAKISNAISGDLGGFRWSATVQQSTNAISSPSFSFKKGDWFNVTDSGTLTYYANNDRSDVRTIPLYAGDDVYWTTNGTLSRKPSTAVQIYPISDLSDWNTLTSPGLYQITSQSGTVANSPIGGRVSCLVSESDGAIGQIAFGNSAGSNNIYYRKKQWNGSWGTWRNVNDVDHATNADVAANYITDQSTTLSIHSKFTSVDSQIYDISNYKKIRVVNNLPSSPDSDTIYFI